MLDATEERQSVPHARPHAELLADRPTERTSVQGASIDFDVPPVPTMDNDGWLDELDASPGMGRPLPSPAPPPPPARKRWFGSRTKSVKTAPMPATDEPPGKVKSGLPLKPVLYLSLCGIVVLSYLQYGPRLDKPQDLLGTSLPSVEPTGPTDPNLIMPAIDPRLGGTDAPSLGMATQPVLALEDDSSQALESVDTLAQANTPLISTELMEPQPTAAGAASPAAAAPVAQTAVQAVSQASVDPALDERMRRMEQLMLEMSQQLAQMKNQQASAGPSAPSPGAVPRPTVQPAPMPQVAPATTAPVAPQRTLVQATLARAPQPQRLARAQPLVKPKAVPSEVPTKPQTYSPRLISVDMWNGEPSVVVASGIPGDKRMRALRPGDVVNGMALRTVDPLTRSVTFVGPNSQVVTLSMATGG